MKCTTLLYILNRIIDDNFFTILSIMIALTTFSLFLILHKMFLLYICTSTVFVWSVLSILKFYKKEAESIEQITIKQVDGKLRIAKFDKESIILTLILPLCILAQGFMLLLSLTPFIMILESWWAMYALIFTFLA